MRFRAELLFTYSREEEADRFVQLLELDNRASSKEFRVLTRREGAAAVTTFEAPRLETFLATLEDLLFCEKLIETVLEAQKEIE
jgi:hypothetical protein